MEYTGDYVENKKHGFGKTTYKKFGSYFGKPSHHLANSNSDPSTT